MLGKSLMLINRKSERNMKDGERKNITDIPFYTLETIEVGIKISAVLTVTFKWEPFF